MAAKKDLGKINGTAPVQKKSTGKMDKKPGAAPVNVKYKTGGMKGKGKC